MTAVETVEAAPVVRWDRLEATYFALHREAIEWAIRVTRDQATAEDVVQEAFLKVFGRVRPLPADEAVRRYLRRAVVNTAFTRLRAERRRIGRETRSWRPEIESNDPQADSALWELVQHLPKRQFTVIALRYWLDQSEAETARLMRCRIGTVKSLTACAMATLRTELGHA